MEEVCATSYSVLTNQAFSGNIAWIKWNGSTWVAGSDETYQNGPSLCPLLTRLSNGVDRLGITVWAGDKPGQGSDTIMTRLETVYAPLDR
jgi:hypothetical protein